MSCISAPTLSLSLGDKTGIAALCAKPEKQQRRRSTAGASASIYSTVRLKESHEDGVVIFALSGAIDLHYAPTLRALFQSKLNKRCPALVVDLTAVDFIDSTGLATLIEYHRDTAAHGGVFSLAGINPNLKAIFDVVQFDKVLKIFPTVAEAKSAIKQGKVPPYMADEPANS